MSIESSERVHSAARDNAAWCEALSRVHGDRGRRLDGLWLCPSLAPGRHPNIVTYEETNPARQLEHVGALLASRLPRPWTVRDSFCNLELGSLGFRMQSEGYWLRLDARPRHPSPRADLHWARIMSGPKLAVWERAASEGRSADRLFPPALLADRRVTVLGALEDRGPVAGAILFASGDGDVSGEEDASSPVVGYSNLFLPRAAQLEGGAEEREAVRASLVWAIRRHFPDRPIVGWEGPGEVSAMEALGFEAVGRLRLWVSPAEASDPPSVRGGEGR